jgi:hypothetical protein
MSNYYRKIWESANGQIPKDKNGRSYEIHHIDGNRSNNKLSNLMCVSIEDHIKIHMNQGELGAVQLITKRLNLSYEKYMEAICKRVNQYDLNGNYIKTWQSASSIEQELGIKSNNITMVCKKYENRKSAGGFMWRYSDDEDLIKVKPIYINKSYIGKPVDQFDLQNNYIKTWPSCTIASKELNIAGTRITAVCRGKKYRKTAGGFIWKYSK